MAVASGTGRLTSNGGSIITQIQYVLDEEGNAVGVIVPIELWREIESERETAYLLRSEAMKRRLLEAKEPNGRHLSRGGPCEAWNLTRQLSRIWHGGFNMKEGNTRRRFLSLPGAGVFNAELMPLPYRIEYSPDAEDHLRTLTGSTAGDRFGYCG